MPELLFRATVHPTLRGAPIPGCPKLPLLAGPDGKIALEWKFH